MNLKIEIVSGNRTVSAQPGENLRTVLEREGVYFPQSCGGKGTCGRCRVDFIENPPPQLQRERELLGLHDTGRLACLRKVTTGLKISLPPIRQFHLEKKVEGFKIEADAEGYGIAVDLGTTTMAVYLLDLAGGEVASQASMINPQVNLGADVMTRLELAKNDSGRKILTGSVNTGLADILERLLDQSGIRPEEITRMIVAGNSPMTHLFHGRGGEGLERAPFRSPFERRGFVPFQPEKIRLTAGTEAETFPIISGFVGGDTAAAILASGLDISGKRILMIDFGTNGEIVLSNRGKLTATSTAAGPAFEGVGMKSGMPALTGAVERIADDGLAEVIGGCEAAGFCGSGYISAIAWLLKTGKLNRSGLLNKDALGIRQWQILDSPENSPIIDQDDIRKFQLAKGAVAAGVTILLEDAGLRTNDLDEVIITGSFGNRIDPAAGVEIGLLPDIDIGRIKYIDNAAGRGAAMCLGNDRFRKRALGIQKQVRTVNLGEHNRFHDVFIENMALRREPQG